jgi:hypothetical protein
MTNKELLEKLGAMRRAFRTIYQDAAKAQRAPQLDTFENMLIDLEEQVMNEAEAEDAERRDARRFSDIDKRERHVVGMSPMQPEESKR